MSEIAERIQFNARRSAEYCDGVVLSDASIDQIIQAETGYEKEIDALRSRIAELESFLCLGEQLGHLLECYGESDEPMTKGAEAIRDWMQEHVIKPKQRIAELEKSAVVWHRYPEEKPIIGHIYNVTCYHESCLIDKYRVIYGVVYSNENDNEQFYAELWNHSLDKPYLTKVSCVIAFSEPLKPYLPAPPEEVSND